MNPCVMKSLTQWPPFAIYEMRLAFMTLRIEGGSHEHGPGLSESFTL